MKSVVLLSGGVDSTVSLAWALANQHSPVALSVDYGQRHRRELDSAAKVAQHYGVQHTIVKLDPVLFGGSALTGSVPVPDGAATEPDETYVPARNTVLLALAAAHAESLRARAIVIGSNKDDSTAYPDCRPSYLHAFRNVLNEGTVGHVWVMAPFINLKKADVITWGQRWNAPLDLTWSCYRGGETPCGTCGACITRGTL